MNFYKAGNLILRGVPLRDQVTVGRQANNTVPLEDQSVSRHHATFFLQRAPGGQALFLRDEGSTNGSTVNGVKVKGETVPIKPLDNIQIGLFRVELLLEDASEPAAVSEGPKATIDFEVLPTWKVSIPSERLEELYKFASDIVSLDTKQLLEAAAKTVARCLHYDVFCVLLRGEGGLEIATSWTAEGPCASEMVPFSATVVNRCLETGHAILAGEPAGLFEEKTSVLRTLSSVICVPLSSVEACFGVMYVSSSNPASNYSEKDLRLLILIACNVASRLSNQRAFRDLQAEKQKLEAILASLKEGVLVTSENFHILSANKAAESIFERAQLVGKQLEDVLSGFRHDFTVRTLQDLSTFRIEKKQARTTGEKKGQAGELPRVFAGTVSRNDDPDPSAWRYVLCLHDISQVQRLQRMKSLFVNRLAHKIVTPLTIVTGIHGLIAKETERLGDVELRKLVLESMKNSEQCAILIRHLIEYTNFALRPGFSLGDWASCPLEDLVDAVIHTNHDLIAQREFKVTRQFAPDVFDVHGDQEKLQLAFHHIVQNAVKFGRQGGKLSIYAECSNQMVKVSFLDDGPGIPPREHEYIGQLLHQVDVENTGETPGAGLGLWLVHEIVQAHGGEARVVSPTTQQGTGTLVEVSLPAAAVAPGSVHTRRIEVELEA